MFQIAVGRGDDADIDGDRFIPAQASNLSVFERGEHFRLERRGKAGQFIEEERSAVRRFEQADARGPGVGERASFVAEQFRFREGVGHGRTIDLDERLGRPGAVGVEPARDRRFAGTCLALNENRRQGGLHPIIGGENFLEVRLHRGQMGAEEKFRSAAPPVFFDPRGSFGPAGATDDERQFRGIERFDQVIERPKPHRFNRPRHTAVSGHDDHARAGGERFFLEQFGRATVGKIDVNQGEIEREIGDEFASGLHGARRRDIDPEFLQMTGDLFAQQRLILQDQDRGSGQGRILHSSTRKEFGIG